MRIREIVLMVLGVGALLLFFKFRNPSVEQPTDSPSSSEESTATYSPRDVAQKESSLPSLRLPTQEAPSTTQFAQELFAIPQFSAPGQYAAAKPLPIEWDKKCSKKVLAKRVPELNQLIRKQNGITGETQMTRDALIEQFGQTWQKGGIYYHVGARWNMTNPATYSLEYYSSKSPTLTGDLTVMPIPGVEAGAVLDTESMLVVINNMLTTAKSEGAQEGGRIARLLVNAPGSGRNSVYFVNSTPMEYSEAGFHCERLPSGKGARCSCGPREGDQ